MREKLFWKSGVRRLLTVAVCGFLACWAQRASAATGDSKTTAASISVKTTPQSKSCTLVEDKEWGTGV